MARRTTPGPASTRYARPPVTMATAGPIRSGSGFGVPVPSRITRVSCARAAAHAQASISGTRDMPHCTLMPMGRLVAAGAALALAACAFGADNELTAKEKAAGWKLLFDGKSYAGWVDPTKKSPPGDSFTIEDGCLKSTRGARIVEDLFTTETFRDFEFEFDWKISPGGNSGVKYRIQDHLMLADDIRGQKFEDRVNASMKSRRTDRPAKGQDYVIGYE